MVLEIRSGEPRIPSPNSFQNAPLCRRRPAQKIILGTSRLQYLIGSKVDKLAAKVFVQAKESGHRLDLEGVRNEFLGMAEMVEEMLRDLLETDAASRDLKTQNVAELVEPLLERVDVTL